MNATIIPTLRYRDAVAMVEWLCTAFGFERRLVVDDGAGGIAHAQLTLGKAMIMLGTSRDDDFDALQSTPEALGGTTQSAYIVVADADAVQKRAEAAGADIVIPVADQDYGGRMFSCRDPEGHLWNIGTYDPWEG